MAQYKYFQRENSRRLPVKSWALVNPPALRFFCSGYTNKKPFYPISAPRAGANLPPLGQTVSLAPNKNWDLLSKLNYSPKKETGQGLGVSVPSPSRSSVSSAQLTGLGM